MGSHISLAPATAFLEQIFCKNYYGIRHPIGLSWSSANAVLVEDCKVEPVQSDMAYINGWKEAFEILPGANIPSFCLC